MTRRPTVLHLVDDTTAGGVMRVVEFMTTSRRLDASARHLTKTVARGAILPRRLRADIVVSHLTLNWRGLPGLLALRAANPRTPMIHIEHSYTEGFMRHRVAAPGRFRKMLTLGFGIFDRIVAVSQAQADWIEAERFCSPAKVTAIASCVDLGDFRACPTPNGPVRVFGAIGRLDAQKGFDTLIEAFRAVPDPTLALHIYGQGEEEPTLRALAGTDPRIHFKGFAASPTEAYAGVDAVVMPSRWEAYGLVAIEALSAGRPVLCADVDGLRDHAATGAQVLSLDTVEAIRTAVAKATSGASIPDVRLSASLEHRFLTSWEHLIAEMTRPDSVTRHITNRLTA